MVVCFRLKSNCAVLAGLECPMKTSNPQRLFALVSLKLGSHACVNIIDFLKKDNNDEGYTEYFKQ